MDFLKLAYSQQILRTIAQGKEKQALLGLATRMAGGLAKSVVSNPLKAAGTALNLYGGANVVNAGVQRSRAFNAAMNPAVGQYIRTPIG